MAEFIHSEEQFVSIGEPIVFENKTDCSFDVDVGVIFRKSGIYKVSIVENRISISKITTRVDADVRTDVRENIHGTWLKRTHKGTPFVDSICSNCGKAYDLYPLNYNYCPNCGARMERKKE